ncbi:hypothetical protein FISHEDRAFT_66658 [Fistulina hepatica ATCC 64428]|uniref:N1221-domain-containing protein n=1 Tax=Fistulina hepatica ATCC 64428 TaxID=1128425 RepID=A0A0D7A4D5_9AGAR|nr:hypothetical protein FISHEDRAFT_66658 [Fistulina hepatica ATCC 64428]
MPQAQENLKAWRGSFDGEWMKASLHQRTNYIELILESLEHHDVQVRFVNARRLSVSDEDMIRYNISVQDKADLAEEVTTEISVYLGMLYHLVEIFKGHDDFADELMSFEPPFPVYLIGVVSSLKDKATRNYPVKKMLLLCWKSLLACWGGMRDYIRVKKLARELAGLPSPTEEELPIKSSPLDIEIFHEEMSVKYPTFNPVQHPVPGSMPKNAIPSELSTKLSQAYDPIPIRHHYHHEESENSGSTGSQFQAQNANMQYRHPQAPTPAPSPPPAPKAKKQQYQTDQTRPFLFPFSRYDKNGRLVPFAIDEADKLYNKHTYISLSLWQMAKTRAECMAAESGLDHLPGSAPPRTTAAATDAETLAPLPDVALLDEKIAEADRIYESTDTPSERRKMKEMKEDLMRLKRVEQIYSAMLPILQPWILVLLKLLLAAVSANNSGSQQVPSAPLFQGVASPPQEQPTTPATLDEIDVVRHREITSKAVAAILLLTLKWFKVSHVMKFHQLGQQLLDTNCLLLILKIFGLQDVTSFVISKADSSENNFFRYCQLHLSKNPQRMRPEDEMLRPPRRTITKTRILPNGDKLEEEVDMVSDFSWRNFFADINFAKIMQKLSKHRSHRIWMLVQYKSSAVLKRILRVQHPLLQLHILKLIKSQVPFCGRKWRQSNMKVITSIYLNIRPTLRDEWLTGSEAEDASDAQACFVRIIARSLCKSKRCGIWSSFRYGPLPSHPPPGGAHRRSGSLSTSMDGFHPGLEPPIRPMGTPNMVEADVFPPLRSRAADSSFLPYITEDIAFEEEYEEYLSDLGWSEPPTSGEDASTTGTSAWSRLPTFATHMVDEISDSESIVSIGDLGDDTRLNANQDDHEDENRNNWEHMSPKTMAALPKSPARSPGRHRSSDSGLRPVLPFGLDDDIVIVDDEDDDVPELGPSPREQTGGPLAAGAGVDEVEYAYGYVVCANESELS